MWVVQQQEQVVVSFCILYLVIFIVIVDCIFGSIFNVYFVYYLQKCFFFIVGVENEFFWQLYKLKQYLFKVGDVQGNWSIVLYELFIDNGILVEDWMLAYEVEDVFGVFNVSF